jgi:type 1 fimbria pilin
MAMKIMKTVSMYASIALIGACVLSMPTSASASERGLSFRGAVVKGGCSGLSAAEVSQVRLGQRSASAQMARDDDRSGRACGQTNVPVEARYVETSSANIKAHSGLITLTYR